MNYQKCKDEFVRVLASNLEDREMEKPSIQVAGFGGKSVMSKHWF